MKLFGRFLITVGISALITAPCAFAQVQFTLMGGLNNSLNTVSGTDPLTSSSFTFKGALGWQAGGEAEVMMNQSLGISLGALYEVNGSTFSEAGAPDVSGTAKGLTFPAVLRLWLGKSFAVGAGGYFADSLDTGGSTDYGYVGNVRLNLPLSTSVMFVVDGKYLGGLKDFGGNKNSEWMANAGFTFGGSGSGYYY